MNDKFQCLLFVLKQVEATQICNYMICMTVTFKIFKEAEKPVKFFQWNPNESKT